MSHISKSVFLLLLLFFSLNLFSQTDNLPKTTVNGVEFYIYEVSPKEGFYTLERKFNISQSEIEKYNPETKAGLKNGQRILIPVKPSTSSSSANSDSYFIHTIIKGENLSTVSNMYKIDKSKIIALNPEIDEFPIIGKAIKIPKIISNDNEYIYNTIEPKETLYSISKRYGLSMEEITDQNPGLTPSTFAIGRIIRLKSSTQNNSQSELQQKPEYELYEVKKKDTYESISRKFKVPLSSLIEANPGQKKIKAKDLIRIPKIDSTKKETANSIAEDYVKMQELLNENFEIKREAMINVSLLLPLSLNKSSQANKQNRYIEFYEGFLLAIDTLRCKGISIDINVFDIDTENIGNIIGNERFKKSDLIIGTFNNSKLNEVSKFAIKNEINIINPFTFDASEVEKNPYLFQLNTPNSYLYAESTLEFIRIFGKRDIVFLNDKNFKDDKAEFTSYLKNQLNLENIKFSEYTYSTTEELNLMDSILALNNEAVFIPLSSSKDMLSNILPALQRIKKNNRDLKISLFGYPEYQTYTEQFMDFFYEMDTYFYTRIYTNPFSNETLQFYEEFKYWYEKDVPIYYPRYAILGYDTGIFFLDAINKYGKRFDSHIDMLSSNSLQTAMCFRRINNWGGFVNRCLYFVNFKPDNTIVRIEVK